MSRPIQDFTGQRKGRLVVIQHAYVKNKNHFWECKCDCGNIKCISTSSLNRGTRSCGCYQKETAKNVKYVNLVGKKFGRLIVKKALGSNKYNQIIWECKCQCGNTAQVTSRSLNSGYSKSCGCLRREGCCRIDLTGRHFGKLVVVEYAGTKNKKVMWKCLCECGLETVVRAAHLTSGSTISCGCITSLGNRTIHQVLTRLNIDHEMEYRFDDCRNKQPLPFDCYIPSVRMVIEFQGRQHYKPMEIGQFGVKTIEQAQKQFEKQIKHDQIKKQYCQDNNIQLVVISYWDYHRIEDILKETLRGE